MKQMAHLDRAAAKSNPHIQVAVIAQTSHALRVADAYDKHSTQSPWKAATFDSREDALAWLGL